MMVRILRVVSVLGLLLMATATGLIAQPTPGQSISAHDAKPLPFLSPIFADNMVLQRGKLDAIWGWTDPGDTVRVQFGEQTVSATAGADHFWMVRIQPPTPGGPYTLTVTGRQRVELHNILVGDVWLCSGQSNMGLPLRFTNHADEVIRTANDPDIRFFTVQGGPAYHRARVVEGKWLAISPESAASVSAVSYYFARAVQQQIHVPIGLVIDSVGGSPAEAWTSEAALRPLHDFDAPLEELNRLRDENAKEYGNFISHWYDRYDKGLHEDWAAPALDDSAWKQVQIPGGFAELDVPSTPAVVWFRKEIVLPDPLPPGLAMLYLGQIERMDTVYVNGRQIGGSSWVENPRVYPVGAALHPGRNLIALRILKTKPEGGFLSTAADLRLVLGDQRTIPFAGLCKAKLSVDARPPQPLPLAYENWPVMPTVLFEGMLAPLAPLSISGALWYQGEQNTSRGFQYRKILPRMLADWRALFAQGDFPFYIVSLPAFTPRSSVPVDGDDWAETRESQAVAAASVPNSCLAVTIDTGDADNIHPKDKQPVGDRLARCALANYYRRDVVDSGPVLASVDRLRGALRLHFTHTDGGLVVKGDKLEEFAIAGEERKWVWAEARVEGDIIVVSSPRVPNPVEVRYAWQANPAATLFNGAGLPAAPFRTDRWPGKTEEHRP